jgi:hypothetical protein
MAVNTPARFAVTPSQFIVSSPRYLDLWPGLRRPSTCSSPSPIAVSALPPSSWGWTAEIVRFPFALLRRAASAASIALDPLAYWFMLSSFNCSNTPAKVVISGSQGNNIRPMSHCPSLLNRCRGSATHSAKPPWGRLARPSEPASNLRSPQRSAIERLR